MKEEPVTPEIREPSATPSSRVEVFVAPQTLMGFNPQRKVLNLTYPWSLSGLGG